jgi:hypothetical protein
MTDRRLNLVQPSGNAEQPSDLRAAARTSIAAMSWLGPTDKALAALALRLAEEIETAVDRGEELRALYGEADLRNRDLMQRLADLEALCNVTKVVSDLGPKLLAALRDLGGTPATRKALQTEAPIGGRLAALRAGAPGTTAAR